MPSYPTKKEIRSWIPIAESIFHRFMPQISAPFPNVYIASKNTWTSTRVKLIDEVGCKNTEPNEDAIMEYIHGDKGYAIIINQSLLPDNSDFRFCLFFWHELGHFYAINSEQKDFHHYIEPGLADNSNIIEYDKNGKPVLGMDNERLKQEGYWFWQEFIAEAISKYISYMHRSSTSSYHPELIDWHPQNWSAIVDKLTDLLENSIYYYSATIDEYSLAHYFANLLMDDFIVLYVKAAAEGKLKVYRGSDIVTTKPNEIEPTCISDIDDDRFCIPLWKMKELVEKQISKKNFWIIDEEFLLQVGRCIGNMMLAKIIVLNESE